MTRFEEPDKPEKPALHKNIYYLAATSFLTDISSEMLYNLLPLFLVNVLGAHRAFVGLIDGVAETTASLVKIFSGSLSDRLGRRKPLTLLGYSLSTLAKPFLFFANSWVWVLWVRFADRVGKGIRTAPRDALIAGSSAENQRGYAFGLHRAGDTAGAFTGLLVAAGIIWFMQSGTRDLDPATFQTIVLASIIPAVLAVIVLAAFVRDVETRSASPEKKSGGQWRSLDGRFKRFLLVMVFFTLGNSSDAFIILRGQERGLSVIQVMGMLLTFNAVYSILAGPLGSLSDRLGRRRLVLIGWTVYAVCYLGLGAAETGWQVWVWFAVYGIYYASTEGIAKALVADFVPQNLRGTAYGFFNAAIGITALPASVLAGLLWQGAGSWAGFGPSAPFFFGAVMAVLAGCGFFLLVKEETSASNGLI